MTERGIIVYQGPSLLDGAPIVAIVTMDSLNEKTGPMAQAWVLRSDIDPQKAIADGLDSSVCGSCVHRSGERNGRSCYVITWFGPLNVYKAFRGNKYPAVQSTAAAKYMNGRQLRITAYGDPAAVPADVWIDLVFDASGWTGYTQRWRECDVRLRKILMASTSSAEESEQANALGWRSYRARLSSEPLRADEIVCPASNEAGHAATCADCGLCRGESRHGAKSIAIVVHGQRAAWFGEKKRGPAFAAMQPAGVS